MYDLRGKHVLVTGATGLIGSAVVHRLLNEHSTLRILTRNPGKAAAVVGPGVEIFKGDIEDRNSLGPATQGCDVVFHFAAVVNDFVPRSSYYRVNVTGTRNLAEAALQSGVERFVHASSVAVYGMKPTGHFCEASPHVRSGDPYPDTKLEAEDEVRHFAAERGLPAVIVQPTQVYGPGDVHWTLRPYRMIRDGRMILFARGTGLVMPIYLDDIVDGIVAAARHGRAGETYILAGPAVVTIHDFFGCYARMLGKYRLPSIPLWLAMMIAALSEGGAAALGRKPMFTRDEVRRIARKATWDGGKAMKELGFTPMVAIDEGMRRVEAWLRTLETGKSSIGERTVERGRS
jgi:nucleoside-diphosphate-sugar epimerase